mmetsp:Transcript_441/g.422  ORF Transcript_441/g.422 Transcript_441/m.422 type:complete len:86 (-) Transcript_441:720-977(-)
MSHEDRELFYCDTKAIDWPEYVRKSIEGTAVHLLKEDHVEPSLGFSQLLLKEGSARERIPVVRFGLPITTKQLIGDPNNDLRKED